MWLSLLLMVELLEDADVVHRQLWQHWSTVMVAGVLSGIGPFADLFTGGILWLNWW